MDQSLELEDAVRAGLLRDPVLQLALRAAGLQRRGRSYGTFVVFLPLARRALSGWLSHLEVGSTEACWCVRMTEVEEESAARLRLPRPLSTALG